MTTHFFSPITITPFFFGSLPSTWAGSLVISDDFDCLEPWELPSPQHSGFHRSVTLPARMEAEPGVPVGTRELGEPPRCGESARFGGVVLVGRPAQDCLESKDEG